MSKQNSTYQRTLVCAGLVALLSACGSAPVQVEALDQANSAYLQVNEDPKVAKYAALELDSAKREIDRANSVWKSGEKKSVVEHHAYLASKRVEIAQYRAEQIEADNQIESMKVKRQQVQIDARMAEVNQAKRESEALQQQIAQLQAEQTERGLVMTLGDVLFQTGQATLAPTAAISIDKIAGFMRQYPEKSAMIEGHTDSMGDEEMNFDLSVQRASAVRTALVQAGVNPSRVTTTGFGEGRPIATNETQAGRQKNRRVDIIFGQAAAPAQ